MSKDSFELFKRSYGMQIQELSLNLGLVEEESIRRAAQMILDTSGKLVLTGMGKSGLIAQKLAATFASTGTPAFFLHPGESLHGDLGALQRGDLLMLLANRGESDEVVQMLQVVKKIGIPVISILGRADSSAGKMSDIIINAVVSREADPLNLAPTASTTVALVVGDALAAAVSELRDFQPENFALYHPAGQLGKRLLLGVEDFLQRERGVPVVNRKATVRELLEVEEGPNLGGVIVVDDENRMVGIVTDGDLRRAVVRYGNVLELSITDLMTPDPISVRTGSLAIDALRAMEDRPSQISVLPVVDHANRPVGLLRIHDLVRAGL